MFYLKYRPQTIAELDNERIKKTLGVALLNNDWAHAYLLLGTRGSGKTTTARLIAKIVNCTSRKKGDEPCNKCDSCVAISEGRSLDVIEIDAASNTGVDDIRELRERVKLAPVGSKFKVYIIDEVHMLSTSAFNALLKTLEEPPEHVIFVLATTDPQKLPATIISRCLVYDFGKASKEEIVSSLKRKTDLEKIDVENGALEILAQKADGSFRDADKLLEQLSVQTKKITLELVQTIQGSAKNANVAREILLKIHKKEAKDGLEIIEKFVSENGSIKLLMNEAVNYLKSLLLLRNGIPSEYEDLPFSTVEIQKLISMLIEANGFVRDSPVAELPLEMVVVEWCKGSNEVLVNPGSQMNTKIQEIKKPDLPKKQEDIAEPEKSDVLIDNQVPPQASDVNGLSEKWNEVLVAVKPYNNHLSALLRSSRPKKIDGDFLTIEAFYKFHMDKLSEPKNREILEKVISGVLGQEIKVKFDLAKGR